MTNSEQSAFPAMDMNNNLGIDRLELRYEGLTKREYFAVMAMQGLLSADAKYGNRTDDRESLAKDAIAHADELLKQLEP